MKEKNKIIFRKLESGIIWPYSGEKKALSASSLIKILKDEEYSNIPRLVLLKAAERGKLFHQAVQIFIEKGTYPAFVDQEISSLNDTKERKIHETINYFKKKKKLGFIGQEKLRYCYYKDKLIASYVDLEFDDCIIELKSNNFSSGKKSWITFITFEIQLLIQHLCTKKRIFMLWSTGEGVVAYEFKLYKEILNVLDMLIELKEKKK